MGARAGGSGGDFGDLLFSLMWIEGRSEANEVAASQM